MVRSMLVLRDTGPGQVLSMAPRKPVHGAHRPNRRGVTSSGEVAQCGKVSRSLPEYVGYCLR